jgi:putative membrane-bound dehydrogenase-like protein
VRLQVGVAKRDATPDFPVRLSGYLARNSAPEATADEKLYARALAIGTSADDACMLVTLDNTGIPASLTEAVAERLRAKLPRERFVLACTHSHCAPCLSGYAPNIFGRPLTPQEREHVERYTQIVGERIEEAALAALADLKPATLEFGQGELGFAANRRTKGGRVDHAMPLLVARDAGSGRVLALLVDYACHCTTLGGDVNRTNGDWAGYAAEAIEREQEGVVALIAIGCGADANPNPRGKIEMARQHGQSVAAEVGRLLGSKALKPISAAPTAKFERIELAFDKIPTREEWQKLAERKDPMAANARLQLARLDRGERLDTPLPYAIQAWTFGDQLAMVFLSGEVVVDYALRLKHDFDPARLWISSYCNDVPCYIPSKRILGEGGYEAEGAMTYYARPGRLAPAVENDIVRAVHAILPTSFRSAQSLEEFPLPKSAVESLETFRLADDSLTIEPVVTEPLVQSPIAIDWDTRGRMWVLEMLDYPSGLHENWTPGGRVKVLESRRHDGVYDKATIYVDGLRFPQGLMCWRDGVIICAAPDILLATGNPGDIHVRKLFSGFSPDNQQWSVNGLAWGLDNWVYGASSVRNDPIAIGDTGRTVDLGGRDFRMNPDTLAFEPASGRTQYCRVRDDFDHWFGNDNSNPLWQYPLEERYVARNPYVTPPAPRAAIVADADPTRLYPASRLLERYNSPESANRVTSGCGPCIYRDVLLGKGFYGNAFFCEPVHSLVRRLTLEPAGVVFKAHRAPADREAEFLASTDNWFRPVQVRTGPDGCLYVVDMHRFLIEHPRWISADRLARIDSRAGFDTGRIYRVRPKNPTPRAVEDLEGLPAAHLAARLDADNGTARDLAHRELIHRQDKAAVAPLREIVQRSTRPAARLQALYALEGLHSLTGEDVRAGLHDENAQVRAGAVRLAEPRLGELADDVLELAGDADVAVRYQAALAVGGWNDPRGVRVLTRIARASPDDVRVRAAVSNGSIQRPVEMLESIASTFDAGPARAALMGQIAGVCAATSDADGVSRAVLLTLVGDAPEPWQWQAAAMFLDAQSRRSLMLGDAARNRLAATIEAARAATADPKAPVAQRIAALRLLGRDAADARIIRPLLQPQVAPALQNAAVDAAGRGSDVVMAGALLEAWPGAAPSLRARSLAVLLSRPSWCRAFLEAVGRGDIPSSQVPTDARARLLKHDDAAIRERAATVFAAASAQPSSRAEVLKNFQPALKLRGDPIRGKELFAQTCAACHLVQGVGHAVGPDLAALTDRSSQYLLTSILDPNAAVEGRYVAYRVQTTDDRDLLGLITDETAAGFSVLSGNGLRETVKRSEIRALKSTGLSLMPDGLEQALTPQGLADLIAFLQK